MSFNVSARYIDVLMPRNVCGWVLYSCLIRCVYVGLCVNVCFEFKEEANSCISFDLVKHFVCILIVGKVL